MHPCGRLESIEERRSHQSRAGPTRDIAISTIQLRDDPPEYHEALTHSKPINQMPKSGDHFDKYRALQTDPLNNHLDASNDGSSERKLSYTMLDVTQLMILSSSPPKYSQIFSSYVNPESNLHKDK